MKGGIAMFKKFNFSNQDSKAKNENEQKEKKDPKDKKEDEKNKNKESASSSSKKKSLEESGTEQSDNKKTQENMIPSSKDTFIKEIKDASNKPADLIVKSISPNLTLMYIDSLIDSATLNEHVLSGVINKKIESPKQLPSLLSIAEVKYATQLDKAILAIFNGAVILHVDGYPQVVEATITAKNSRGLQAPENESQVIGSQVGFNESLSTNESLIRRYIKTSDLCNEKFTVGKRTNTTVTLFYLKDIASEEMVNTLRQRITDLEIDALIDSAVLAEMIDDNSLSIFPQMLLTERPDRFCDSLLNGKLGIVVDGSSMSIICPQSFLEFFQSREDQNLRWPIATFVRLLRFSAVFLSVYFTPVYVAALTFHYEVIPQSLLVPLSESRALVPFPPIIEALLLEFIIELLREAGARLPTKVGQTIGIVGGIVIGTAAVQAGITSNILIIIVALSALASFTTPSYMMGNVIRILRFPLIILAGFWGFYGIMLGFCFLLIHLLRQSSLGSPYTAPFYPPRVSDWRDSLIRLPLSKTYKRPSLAKPDDATKYEPEPINPEKS